MCCARIMSCDTCVDSHTSHIVLQLQSTSTSNFTIPLIFDPYHRLAYLSPRTLRITLSNISNSDTYMLPWGGDVNSSITGVYHDAITHDVMILPAFPRVGFSTVEHNLTDVMTSAMVQIECQYCQGKRQTCHIEQMCTSPYGPPCVFNHARACA